MIKISLKKYTAADIGIFLLLLSMYSIGTISAISVSWTFTLILLLSAVNFLLINYVLKGGKYISKICILWLIMTIFCMTGVLIGASFTLLIFYVLCFIILILSEAIPDKALSGSLKWMRFFGVFFAVGCYWQYLFPNQYYAALYPLFGTDYQQSIRRQFTFHKMCTGFTAQTAVAAEFIVLGLMAAVYLYSTKDRFFCKFISLAEIILISGALLLTGKRSPLINLAVAFITVDMVSVKRGKKATRFLGIFLGLAAILVVLYYVAPMFSDSSNSFVRIMDSLASGNIEDMANGRFSLYSSALTEFWRNPVLGIGWGKYSIKYNVTGAHNIYLQILCECGIIGFLMIATGMIIVAAKTVKMLKSAIAQKDRSNIILLKCSVFIQVYILIYGLFGNPIYDQNYLLMYLFGIFISTKSSFEYI